VRGVLVYMAIYVIMNLGAFAVILSMKRDGRMVETIGDLAGLSRTQPVLAGGLAVAMFSMAGIPPLAGFFGKLYVFLAAVSAGLYLLAVIGVVASVIGAYYYLRIVKIMYFDEPAPAFDAAIEPGQAGVLGVSTVFTLFFFLWPVPLVDAAAKAAASLFGG
jgi:NADH-quinone oxidoreductase subunit N